MSLVPDAERWRRLSPLLDEMLELEPAARGARLDAWRGRDPALAAELAALLADAARLEATPFLAGNAQASLSAASADALAGHRIGAYELEASLGQGGAGTVWRARRADGRFDGTVAVKLLHLSLVGQTGARRFEREGAILARLSHPHIARLLDAGVSDGGQPYLVLELVDGQRIDRYCDARRLNVADRIDLFRVVLEAVAHAHRHLVVHRDIKPANILVSADGSVKLLDFGIAKLLEADAEHAVALTGDGGRAMTPDYAAPEQLRGGEVTTATDVYALGVLLYQLLTGRHPTAPAGATAADLIRSTLDADPGRLANAVTADDARTAPELERVAAERDTSPVRLRRQLGGDLENIVAKALRKAPAERYATVDAFADDLRRWQAGEPVSARADSLAYRASRFIGRHRGKVAAGMLTLVAILAGLVGTFSQARRAERQSALAAEQAAIARHERDAALEQARLQRGSNEFLQLLLRDSAGGDPGTIRRQLDHAVALLETTRFEAPIVKVALLRQTAGRYVEIGDVASSVRLLRQAIASIQGTPLAAPTNGVPVNLACSLARNLHEMDDQPGALAELDRADRLIAAGADVSTPGRIECRVTRAFAEGALGHFARSVDLDRDALRELEAAGIGQGEQHRVTQSALTYTLAAAGRAAEAMPLARALLAETRAGGRESVGALRRSAIVTSLTRIGGDPLAALALADADIVDAARLLGPRDDAALELERGLDLIELGRAGDATAALARAGAAALAMGRQTLVLPAGLAETEALLLAGRVEAANERWNQLAPLRDAAARQQRPEQIAALRVAALLARAQGDDTLAASRLTDAQQQIDAAGGVAHPLAFAVAAARGELAIATKQPAAAALPFAEQALAAARRTSIDAERSSQVGQALLLRARIEAGAGRTDDARRDANAAAAQLGATLGADAGATRAAQALAAQG